MKNIIGFLIGLAVSGVVGYKIGCSTSRVRYQTMADQEIKSMKLSLDKIYGGSKKVKDQETSLGETDPANTNGLDRHANAPVRPSDTMGVDYGKQYRTTTSAKDRIPGEPGEDIVNILKPAAAEVVDTTKPYIISPEEYADSSYETVTLFYCADKVLTDEDYNPIKNIGIVGGHPILNQMGIYDADCLYVRSNADCIDYEIVVEERTFSQITPLGIVDED